MKELRHITNAYPDFSAGISKFNETTFLDKVRTEHAKVLGTLKDKYPPNTCHRIFSDKKKSVDISFYTGTGGNVLVYWRQYELYKHLMVKEKMVEHLTSTAIAFQTNVTMLAKGEVPARKLKSPSFFSGPAGLYTIGALLFKERGDSGEMLKCYKEVINSLARCKGKDAEDDLLFGNAGYLYCLLLLFAKDPVQFDCRTEIKQVVELLKHEGLSSGSKDLLTYTYPRSSKKFYYGAAHGLMGILYMLIKAIVAVEELSKDAELVGVVEHSCEYMLSQQYPSGNFPSSHGSANDRLVQFCHGATGAIPFLLAAYRMLKKDTYLTAALKAGEAVWAKGILKKGNGLCHGITGNAYALHSLYRATGDDKWKYRCYMFADASWNPEVQKTVAEHEDHSRLSVGIPDTPYSLMEGIGGTAVFYADLLGKTEFVRFPGYEL